MAIGVFVVDDQELLRVGVSAVLATERDIVLVGEAGRAVDALARIQATRPDVVLLDTRLPDGDGVALCRAIRSAPNPAACLILTASADDPALVHALVAGAAGYVLKSVHGSELVEAVRKIADGGLLCAPGEVARADPLKGLGETDREIVHLIGEGMTNRQVGEQMGLSERTIKNHVSHVLTVLGMERRTQIAVLAASLKAEGAF